MRRCLATYLVVGIATSLTWIQAGAAELGDVTAARRALETAQLRLRLYEREEYPRKLHRLERDIELAQAHVESYQRRLREYEQFDKLSYSSPLFLTLERTRLSLRQAELQMEDLQEQRTLLVRHHTARRRLYVLEVEAAAAHLSALGKRP